MLSFFGFFFRGLLSQLWIAKNETRKEKKETYGSPPRLIPVLIDIPLYIGSPVTPKLPFGAPSVGEICYHST